MIATRQFRMSARKQSRTGAADDPTPMDLQHIDAFAEKIKEAVALLRNEIDAINAGNLDVVSESYEKKSGLLKWLELKRPLVEPFIKKDAAIARRLPELLEDLRVAVTENSSLLSRMAEAAGSVAREIEKATQRHSLNGLYGQSGKKVADSTVTKMTIDREF